MRGSFTGRCFIIAVRSPHADARSPHARQSNHDTTGQPRPHADAHRAGILGAAAAPAIARAAESAPTTFPFTYAERQIRFAATVDGRGPLTFLLDSGAGGNVVFTGAAQRVGLSCGRKMNVTGATGDVKARMAHVDKLVVGPLTLENQGVVVLDVPAAEALGLDGIVGWELLRRFATTVDFDARTITGGAAPRTCRSSATRSRSRSTTGPRIAASVDGIDGLFDIDTGDNGGISLFDPFVRRSGLLAKTPPRFVLPKAAGTDVGGQGSTYGVARGTAFRIGPLTLTAPLYRYITATTGVFARTDLAGNLGTEIWDRFTLTFDYPRSRVFLRPGRNPNHPFAFNRTGLIINPTSQGVIVIAVVPASPAAAAGAAAGDRVVSVAGRSVDGAGAFGVAATAFLQPVGTVLPVRLLRANTPLDVTLTLADLV